MRLDVCLVEKFDISSRHKAQALIMKGDVMIGTQVITKSGYALKDKEIALIQIKVQDPYVGFGAYKLLKAIESFKILFQDKITLDIGASTGGFTQVMLEQGAKQVYAIDVGENQLDYILREDRRVISYEKTNIRIVDKTYFVQGYPTFFTVDVSFISLSLVFPILQKLSLEEGIVLIKPQFEVGKDIKNFKGYVREPVFLQKAIDKVTEYAITSGYKIADIIESPEQHKGKNQEYLAYIKKL